MTRTSAAVTALLLAAGSVSACGDDDADPADTGDVPADEAEVPFDPDVPEGVDTETDERDNLGFDDDTGGEPGNVTDLGGDD